jgi:TonB family protein
LLAGFAVAMGLGVAVVIVDVGAAEATKARRKAKEPFPEDIQFGGGFEVAPKVKFFPRTVFPPFLIAEGISGHAVVRCRINWEGYVEEAKVMETNHPAFGAAALGTVGRMVFDPATKAGKPVPTTAVVSFRFVYE